MDTSLKPKKELRSKIGRIAMAVAFAVVIGSVGVGLARAQDHNDGDRGYRGPNIYYAPQPDYYYAPQPDYYYAPQPDYYSAPEPDRYYTPEPEYYAPQPEYYPPPPSQGIHLFFGF
jgi:annexin A7/11